MFAYIPRLQEYVARARCSTLRQEWTHMFFNYSHTYVYKFNTHINTFINPYTYINQIYVHIFQVFQEHVAQQEARHSNGHKRPRNGMFCADSLSHWLELGTLLSSAKEPYVYLRKRFLRISPQPRKKALCLSRKILSLRRTAAFLRKRALTASLSVFGREHGVFLTCISSGTCIYMSLAGTGAEKKKLQNHRLPPINKPNVNPMLFLARHHNYSSGAPRIISDSDWKFEFVSRNLRYPDDVLFQYLLPSHSPFSA